MANRLRSVQTRTAEDEAVIMRRCLLQKMQQAPPSSPAPDIQPAPLVSAIPLIQSAPVPEP